MAASFAGLEGLEKFKSDLNRLLDYLADLNKTKPVRVILLSPVPHERLPAPMPNPAAHNQVLEKIHASNPGHRRGTQGTVYQFIQGVPGWR